MNQTYAISCITLIYNSSRYLEKSVTSLLEQDFENVEFIFVDDGSTDDSVEVLHKIIEQYPARKAHIKIEKHGTNKGTAAARTTALLLASGEFTIHLDSDDWFDKNMLSALYAQAATNNYDIVICDFYRSYPKNELYRKMQCFDNFHDNFSGILNGTIHGALWNKLIRRSLYVNNNIKLTANINLMEDKWLLAHLFYYGRKVGYLPQAFLHYRFDNPDSVTKKLDHRRIQDIKFYYESIKAFLVDKNVYGQYESSLLSGVVGAVLLMSKGENYTNSIQEICPKANKLKYLWNTHYFNWYRKLVFSFAVLGLPFVVRVISKIHATIVKS